MTQAGSRGLAGGDCTPTTCGHGGMSPLGKESLACVCVCVRRSAKARASPKLLESSLCPGSERGAHWAQGVRSSSNQAWAKQLAVGEGGWEALPSRAVGKSRIPERGNSPGGAKNPRGVH